MHMMLLQRARSAEKCSTAMQMFIKTTQKSFIFLTTSSKKCAFIAVPRKILLAVVSYPKCSKQKCRKETNTLKTKKKTVLAADLAPDCKKIKVVVTIECSFAVLSKCQMFLKEIDFFGRKEYFSTIQVSFDEIY